MSEEKRNLQAECSQYFDCVVVSICFQTATTEKLNCGNCEFCLAIEMARTTVEKFKNVEPTNSKERISLKMAKVLIDVSKFISEDSESLVEKCLGLRRDILIDVYCGRCSLAAIAEVGAE